MAAAWEATKAIPQSKFARPNKAKTPLFLLIRNRCIGNLADNEMIKVDNSKAWPKGLHFISRPA
jgi:hypothetical protein